MESGKGNKLIKAEFIIFIALLCISICLVSISLFYSYQVVKTAALLLNIALMAAACYSAKMLEKLRPVLFIFILLVISLIPKVIFVIKAYFVPTSDFGLIYEAAKNLALGDSSNLSSQYFQTWAYQTTMVLYEAFVLKLFSGFLNSGVLLLKLFNCIYVTATTVFIYVISRKIAGEMASKAVSIFYALSPVTLPLLPVLTNQHPANALFFGALTVIVYKSSYKHAVAAAALLALGNAFRPMGLIPLMSVLIAFLIKKKVKSAVIISAVYVLLSLLISELVIIGGINKNGLSNQFPEWKFVVGLNISTNGVYSGTDAADLFSYTDTAARSAASKTIIKERLLMWRQFPKLFSQKLRILFTADEYICWSYKKLSDLKPYVFIGDLARGAITITLTVFFLSLIYSAAYTIKNKVREHINIFIIILLFIFVFYTGIHLIIEVQGRYRDFIIPVMLILSSSLLCSRSRFILNYRICG